MSIAQSLLPEFDHEFATLRTTLERVPDGKWDYAPHAKSMNLARLTGHLAELGVYLQLNDVPVPSSYGPSADEGQM